MLFRSERTVKVLFAATAMAAGAARDGGGWAAMAVGASGGFGVYDFDLAAGAWTQLAAWTDDQRLLKSGEADMVVGSKAMSGAHVKRPLLRRAATQTINGMLRVLLDFRGTDTHGLKAFRRDRLLDTLSHCVVDKDLFASEFVIRAQREGKRVEEIPVHIVEKRPPSINLFKRVPNVLKNLARLTYVIRIQNPH